MESNVKVNFSTYLNFFFSNKGNYFFFSIALILFLITEVIVTIYYRILVDYSNMSEGSSTIFEGSMKQYWMVLCLLVAALFLLSAIKYYLLNISILRSSTTIHNRMI